MIIHTIFDSFVSIHSMVHRAKSYILNTHLFDLHDLVDGA